MPSRLPRYRRHPESPFSNTASSLRIKRCAASIGRIWLSPRKLVSMTKQLTARPPAVNFDHHDHSIAHRIHDVYRELRSSGPLHWSEHNGGYWVATGYDTIQEIVRSPSRFIAAGALIPDITGGNALVPQMLEDPDHRIYRTLLKGWFTPRRIAGFEPVVRKLANQYLGSLESPGDLASGLAVPLPMEMILRVIGVQDRDMGYIRDGLQYLLDHGGEDPAGATTAWQGAIEFIRDVVLAPLRDNPGDDLLSFLLRKQNEIDQLSDDMIALIGFSIVGAGFDTTFKTMSSSLAYFAMHPETQVRARRTPSGAVVEEMLRMVGPVASGRLVVTDTVVAGHSLRRGDQVLLVWPAANRDPAQFADPDAPMFDRNNNRHVAFGAGVHRCLGMHLARLELRVAFEEVFREFDEFHIEPGAAPTFVQGHVCGATSVPVAFRRPHAR